MKSIRDSTSSGIDVPEVVFMAWLDVTGSSVRTREADAGIDGYFTVLTLSKKMRQRKRKIKYFSSTATQIYTVPMPQGAHVCFHHT